MNGVFDVVPQVLGGLAIAVAAAAAVVVVAALSVVAVSHFSPRLRRLLMRIVGKN